MGIFSNIFSRPKDAEEIASGVAMFIAQSSFDKFREKEFKNLLNFEQIGQEEQDRIFNELVVTGLCLIYLTLERGERENPNAKSQNTFRQIKNQIVGGYVHTLTQGGVSKELTDLWYQLVAMRCEEYRYDYKTHKKMFSDGRENYWVHVCAIGGSDHICRGKNALIEKLLPDISKWCGKIYIESMRILAKELHATLAATGKTTQVNIKDDGSLDLK